MKYKYIVALLSFVLLAIGILLSTFFKKSQRLQQLKRKVNQLHAYEFKSENNQWQKYSNKPVLGDIVTGSMFEPYVILNDDKLVMFVSERQSGNIIKVESYDGMRWTNRSTVLKRENNTWASIINRACVQKVDSLWYMWFTGQTSEKSCIGFAQSNNMDIFVPSEDPVIVADQKGEGCSVMNPCVLYDEVTRSFQMWYSAGDNYEPDAIFYATSKDGKLWNKRRDAVLKKYKMHKWESYKIGGCDVIKNPDGSYIMYYIGYQNLDVARICYAVSKDGINWSRPENNLVIGPSVNSWDKDAIYKPSILRFKDNLYLWYNGRNGGDEYIGLAIHP